MFKPYKYRIYPNKAQKALLAKSFGCSRYIYNTALNHKNNCYQLYGKSPSAFDLNSGLLMEEKSEHDWLKEVPAQCLQQSISHLDRAFKNFFKKKSKFPKFKSLRIGKTKELTLSQVFCLLGRNRKLIGLSY